MVIKLKPQKSRFSPSTCFFFVKNAQRSLKKKPVCSAIT